MRAIKKLGKKFLYWFFNQMLHVKMDQNVSISKIYHRCYLENLIQLANIDELINDRLS